MPFKRLALPFAAALLASAIVFPAAAQEMAKPSTEMQAVLDKLAALDAKPFSTLTVPEARTQASPADAAKAVKWDKRALAGHVFARAERGNLHHRFAHPGFTLVSSGRVDG